MQKHTFSLFLPTPPHNTTVGAQINITDAALMQRIEKVLRVAASETVILFHEASVLQVRIDRFEKKQIVGTITQVTTAQPLQPQINLWLPLIERDAFEHAVYMATVFGVQTITPLITHKTKRAALTTNELNRLHRVMIAAAEQSKQYILPIIQPIQTLENCLKKNTTSSIVFFDQEGLPAQTVFAQIGNNKSESISCLFGPEGDLTEEEKVLLDGAHAVRCTLTSTTLRTEHAVALGVGMLRTLCKKS